jgi:hypothetical protein
VFAFIISSAAVGTTVRAKYEFTLETEIDGTAINDYPPSFARCFVDSEPALQLIN